MIGIGPVCVGPRGSLRKSLLAHQVFFTRECNFGRHRRKLRRCKYGALLHEAVFWEHIGIVTKPVLATCPASRNRHGPANKERDEENVAIAVPRRMAGAVAAFVASFDVPAR